MSVPLAIHLRRAYRIVTGAWRVLPNFVIIGAQRAGTTSLYNYLIQHPSVVAAFSKEVHYFDQLYHRGERWYRSFFPCRRRQPFVTGESSPYYLFHPHAPRRLAELLPNARLIVLLRNPVDRALSHYHHEVRLGVESLPFEAALEREAVLLPDEQRALEADPMHNDFIYLHYSYLTRGIYVNQLRRWMKYIPRERILILQSEQLYQTPVAVVAQVLDFLELPAYRGEDYPQYNQAYYTAMAPAMRQQLESYFAPHNQRLYTDLGVDFGW